MRRAFKAPLLPLFVYIVLAAAPAIAQDLPQPSAPSENAQAQVQGPLVLEPVHTGLLITPDVKITRLDNTTRTLVGAYGGWLVEDTLLVGAGGYWLADGSRDQGMAYGGFVAGWTMPATRRIRFGARVLVGGGQATLANDVTFTAPVDVGRDGFFGHHDDGHVPTTTFTGRARFHQGFFIAEPQAELVLGVTRWMAIDVAAGYRAIAAARGLDSQLRGPVGSLGLRLGL